MGWQGKVLRVNLTNACCESEPLNMEWANLYMGQRGLGTKYLSEEMDPAVDPLSPENKMIFATGPLTGTAASTAGRYSVITKGALTNAIACSNSGGYFGAELKFAGWDMIIVEGASEKPVYLLIENENARLIDADDFIWGRSVWDTENLIRARHQDPDIRIASIGIAGEKCVRYACVMNDLHRAAGRSGVGAVMGSKQLKAIAVRGTGGVAVKHPDAFMAAVASARAKLDHSATRKRLEGSGTMAMMDVTNAFGSLPTRNSQEVQFESVPDVNAAAMKKTRLSDGHANLQTNKACFGCTIGCGRISRIDPNHFSVAGKSHYTGSTAGLEYESGFALAPLLGINDIEAATYANAVCNEQGMDPISFGGALAAAMELFEAGALTPADTGNFTPVFGSAEALVTGVEMAGTGVGFGVDLGLGAKRLCEKYGRPEFAMVVKGQEFPGYDGRAMQGMGLGYATSNRGACHLKASTFAVDFSDTGTDGKAEVVRRTQDEIAAHDSTGLCIFPRGEWGLPDVAAQIDGACGGGWNEDRLRETGERIWNLERLFNLKAGLTRADDTLPDRILHDALKTGAAKGNVAELSVMIPEYYKLRGWTEDGVPSSETLARLGLSRQ